MNKLKLLSIITMSFILFGACTKKRDLDSKVLNISVKAKIKGMDPIYANDMYSSNEVARVYEGLLEYHYLKSAIYIDPKSCGSNANSFI